VCSSDLTLASLILAVGAANTLANPKRLLAAVPTALAEYGTATVVALSVFPQLAESVERVRRARRLRGAATGRRRPVRDLVMPVLADSLDRSLALAAAMDARGYGQTIPGASRRATNGGFVAAVITVSLGGFGLLRVGPGPAWLGAVLLVAGLVLAVWALRRAGQRRRRTRYRRDRWTTTASITLGCGLASAIVIGWLSLIDPAALYPSTPPLAWPPLPWPALLAAAIAALPAVITPPPTERFQPASVDHQGNPPTSRATSRATLAGRLRPGQVTCHAATDRALPARQADLSTRPPTIPG
jgi:energy-coupling factor transport system permease protein